MWKSAECTKKVSVCCCAFLMQYYVAWSVYDFLIHCCFPHVKRQTLDESRAMLFMQSCRLQTVRDSLSISLFFGFYFELKCRSEQPVAVPDSSYLLWFSPTAISCKTFALCICLQKSSNVSVELSQTVALRQMEVRSAPFSRKAPSHWR